jgi:RNA polymerase sigma factor (sigma-70 family)
VSCNRDALATENEWIVDWATYRHCRQLRRREDRQDARQEARLALFRAALAYVSDGRATFTTYAAKSVCHALMNWLAVWRRQGIKGRPARQRIPPRSLDLTDEATDTDPIAAFLAAPDDRLDDRLDGAALMAAMRRLSEADRRILAMKYCDQLSGREIGRRLGVPERTSNARLCRALGRLRAIVRNGGDPCE